MLAFFFGSYIHGFLPAFATEPAAEFWSYSAMDPFRAVEKVEVEYESYPSILAL